MLDHLKAWLGPDWGELAGATCHAEIPLTASLINRFIADRLARGKGRISAAVVEVHDADRLTVHLRPRAALLPPIQVNLQVVAQPEFPASPVLVLRWSLAGGLGVMARMASPVLALFDVMPPGIRIDCDLVGIDVAELLRARGFGRALPFIRQLQVKTVETTVRITVALAR
jgi:hypothetical protein